MDVMVNILLFSFFICKAFMFNSQVTNYLAFLSYHWYLLYKYTYIRTTMTIIFLKITWGSSSCGLSINLIFWFGKSFDFIWALIIRQLERHCTHISTSFNGNDNNTELYLTIFIALFALSSLEWDHDLHFLQGTIIRNFSNVEFDLANRMFSPNMFELNHWFITWEFTFFSVVID